MCEAIFKILRFGKSLELISTSYQLLNELDRVLRSILFPYICFYSSLSPHGCMREFDALCLPPVQKLSPGQIKWVRVTNRVSQPVFAAYLNLSPSTVQQWERGDKEPSGPSLKLLNLVRDKGLAAIA